LKKALLIHPAELSREWVETIKTAGCNVLALHPVGGDRAHLFLEQMLEDMEKQEFKDVINYAVDLGIEIEYEMHAAHYFLPDSLFLEHLLVLVLKTKLLYPSSRQQFFRASAACLRIFRLFR